MHFDSTHHKEWLQQLLDTPGIAISVADVELVAELKKAVREASCGVKGQHPDSVIRLSGEAPK